MTVGLMEVPPTSLRLADLVSDFHGTNPGVEVSITSGSNTHLLDLVQQGAADCAIVAPRSPSSSSRSWPTVIR